MEISAATVAVSLKKLEKGGYIERHSSRSDNRSNVIALTRKGEDVVEQSGLLFEEVDEKMFAGISLEEQEKLHGFLEHIITNIKTMEDNQT